MPLPLKFVVVDFHSESRFLLVKTLLRKFPGAVVYEIDDAESALAMVRRREVSAVITHRTFDVTGIDLVREFRSADATIPIVMVSGIDREEAAVAAGANCFLPYDEWLRVGTIVESLLTSAAKPSPNTPEPNRVA